MVDMGISSNDMKSLSPKRYTYFLGMTIYNDILQWKDISLSRDIVTELDFITDIDLITKIPWGFHRTF